VTFRLATGAADLSSVVASPRYRASAAPRPPSLGRARATWPAPTDTQATNRSRAKRVTC